MFDREIDSFQDWYRKFLYGNREVPELRITQYGGGVRLEVATGKDTSLKYIVGSEGLENELLTMMVKTRDLFLAQERVTNRLMKENGSLASQVSDLNGVLEQAKVSAEPVMIQIVRPERIKPLKPIDLALLPRMDF